MQATLPRRSSSKSLIVGDLAKGASIAVLVSLQCPAVFDTVGHFLPEVISGLAWYRTLGLPYPINHSFWAFFDGVSVSTRFLTLKCLRQKWLHHLQGLVRSENVKLLVPNYEELQDGGRRGLNQVRGTWGSAQPHRLHVYEASSGPRAQFPRPLLSSVLTCWVVSSLPMALNPVYPFVRSPWSVCWAPDCSPSPPGSIFLS